MIDRPDNINVFILYAAADEDLKNELESHLSMLHRHGYIDVWHEGKMTAGVDKDMVISEYLGKSHIILLLVSSNFLAPDCYSRYDKELRLAYERQKKGEVKIIPVILRHCMWQLDILGSLNPLPKGGYPVRSSHWESSDLAYQNIAMGLQKIANDLLQATQEIQQGQQSQQKSQSIRESQPPTQSKIENENANKKTGAEHPQPPQGQQQQAEQLINDLFNLFQKLDPNTCAQMAISIIHHSQVKYNALEENFLKYKFLKAYENAQLYHSPVRITGIKPTGRKSIGLRSEKEVGEEVLYEIARREEVGALPGQIRIFFPAAGTLAKISNLSL